MSYSDRSGIAGGGQMSLFPRTLVSYRTASGKVVEAKPRGKHYVEPRGYAAPPGTGPAGETCGTCQYRTYAGNTQGSYPKCALRYGTWTGGRATDILVHAAACEKWEKVK